MIRLCYVVQAYKSEQLLSVCALLCSNIVYRLTLQYRLNFTQFPVIYICQALRKNLYLKRCRSSVRLSFTEVFSCVNKTWRQEKATRAGEAGKKKVVIAVFKVEMVPWAVKIKWLCFLSVFAGCRMRYPRGRRLRATCRASDRYSMIHAMK